MSAFGRPVRSSAPLLWLLAGLCLAAVAAALVSQYRFDMQPCPWCTFQRLLFLVIAALAVLGAVVPARGWRRGMAGLSLLVAVGGVASALWQHQVAAASDSCNLTLADKVMQALGLYEHAPALFAPMASCADAAVNLLGLAYAYWSLGVFVACGGFCVAIWRR